MALTKLILLLTITLFILKSNATSPNSFSLSPLFSPSLDDVCDQVNCGRGKCKGSKNGPPYYTCKCDKGWIQSRGYNEGYLDFLPCILPECSLDYACQSIEAPSTNQQRARPTSGDAFFDPCVWSYCGGGACQKISAFTHTCDCYSGYQNLLSVAFFPCLKECGLGRDCQALGISGVSNSSLTMPADAPESDNSQGNVCETMDCNTFGIGGFNHSTFLTPPALPDSGNNQGNLYIMPSVSTESEASTFAGKLDWFIVSIMWLGYALVK